MARERLRSALNDSEHTPAHPEAPQGGTCCWWEEESTLQSWLPAGAEAGASLRQQQGSSGSTDCSKRRRSLERNGGGIRERRWRHQAAERNGEKGQDYNRKENDANEQIGEQIMRKCGVTDLKVVGCNLKRLQIHNAAE